MNNDEFRKLTEEARNADLVEFFRNNGYTVQRMGSEYRVPEFGLMINPDKHLWNCFYTEAGGGRSSIDCVMKILDLDIHEAVYMLTGREITSGGKRTHHEDHTPKQRSQPNTASSHQQKVLQMPEKNPNEGQLIAYMCKTRRIPKEIVYELIDKGLLYQSKPMILATAPNGEVKRFRSPNAVFVHKDSTGKVVGAEIQGLNSERRFKSLATGTRNSAFMFTPVPAKDGRIYRAFIFESAIDLLSFYTFCEDKIKLTGAALVSMGGLKPSIPKQLESQGVRIISCVDNDDARRRFEKENNFERPKSVIAKLDNQGFKDWNELLVFKTSNPDAHLEHTQPEPAILERVNENERPVPTLAMTRRA